MYLVLILARKKGFLGGHSQEFRQELKRVNPRRFRHLHGWLGLLQGFQGFSYKQRASQHNSSPSSSRKYHSISSHIFDNHTTKSFRQPLSSARVFKTSRRRRSREHHHHHHISTSTSPSSTCLHNLDNLWSRIQGFVVSRF